MALGRSVLCIGECIESLRWAYNRAVDIGKLCLFLFENRLFFLQNSNFCCMARLLHLFNTDKFCQYRNKLWLMILGY